MRDQGESLQRLSETHVVGEDAAESMLPEEGEPVVTVFLVGPEGGVDGTGEGGRLNRIDGEESLGRLPPGLRFDGLIGEILKLRPEAGLVAADPHPGFPLGQGRGLVD